MDAQLLALAKAQDDFRQTVAVGLTDLKSIYDACAREHGNEQKQRANEQESARRAIEGAHGERDKLEQKLMQCEHALSETKHALVETKEKAKDASVANATEKKDLLMKLESVVEEKKKNEDALKAHAHELKQQLILMQTKLDRAAELDKDLHEKLKVAEIAHREKGEEYKKIIDGLKGEIQDRDIKIESASKEMKQHERESLKQHDAINRLEAKIDSLNNELDSAKNQCVQWQRECDMAKAAEQNSRNEAEAAKEERMREEKSRSMSETQAADARRKCEDALAEAAENKQNRKLAEQALDVKEAELKEVTHKAQLMEKDYRDALNYENEEHAATEDRLEKLKQQSFDLYNAYTSTMQQLEEYRAALERESQEAANLHAALAKQKEEAARDALRTRTSKFIAPPAGYVGSPSPSRARPGVSINDMDDLRSPPSFD